MKSKMLLMLLAVVAVGAQATVRDAFQHILPVTDTALTKSLNGSWSLKVVDGISDEKSVPAADDTWGTIPVPGCWEAYGFSKPSYDRADSLTGYYRTTFTVPAAWRGQCIVLRLDGVLYAYDLWVNGRLAGSWASAYNTALFDITPYLTKNGPQQLALRVVSHAKGSDFDYNDDWAPCGIFRDVTLFAVPQTHLSDLTITTKKTGEVSVATEVANGNRHTMVTHEILDARRQVVGRGAHCRVSSPHLWTAETPYLYTLRTQLLQKGKVLQTFEHRFGIRELTIDGKVLKLNGQPIKLRGVTCHATDPRTVKVIGDTLTLKDMRLMKEASVNYIRTSHYPREPRFYELADSLGFYVIDEVPFGYGDKHLTDSSYYEILQQRAQATVRRDKNHASVLLWSVGNENPLTPMCQDLGTYVRQELDPSRFICYPQVGSYFRKFNYDFPKVADLYAPHYPTTAQIAGFYQHSDRPVIFTEYCHTLGISFEDHDRQWELIERTPWIAGGSVWEWVDQGMPFREELKDRYGYEERVFTSPHGGFEMCGNKGTDGLLYADRTPLPNYYELQHNYARAAVTDSVLCTGTDAEAVTLHIRNRFDFINLKDNVTFRWTLTADRDTMASGAFSPDCPARFSVQYPLALPLSAVAADRICLLHLALSDAQGHVFLRQSLPVNPQDQTDRWLEGLTEATDDPMTVVQNGWLLRAGRKATLAERLRIADKRLERYLLPVPTGGGRVVSDQPTAFDATIKSEAAGHATHVTFSLTPDSTDAFLSELGLAVLLDPRIDRVQWIGNGLMPTCPGRFRAGRYGFWGLRKDDLYLEGNRMGVDAAWLTDKDGNGLLLLCRQGNVSFEQTDRGIVLTYNVAVAGQGPKFARTAFPVTADKVGTRTGEFWLYRTAAGHLPVLLQRLFLHPETLPEAFHPFETQYDTYLMRFEDLTPHR